MAIQSATTTLREDRTAFAVAMVLTGITLVTATDLATKWISSGLSIWQLLFMRSAFGLILLFPLLFVMKQLRLIRPLDFRPVIIRSLLMMMSYLGFFTALAAIPVALVAGAFFSFPLFMVILSRIMLNEQTGKWRAVSVLSGFCGVLLILRPDSASFDWFTVVPVIAGFFYAATQIYTRKYCKNEHSLALSFWLTSVFMAVGLTGMLGLHLLPATEQPGFLTYPLLITDHVITLTLIAIAIGSLAMHFSLASAYQNAPASLIAPLEYLYMPLAVLGGFVFFDETPHPTAISGIAIIISAGLIITWRERLQRQKDAVTHYPSRP